MSTPQSRFASRGTALVLAPFILASLALAPAPARAQRGIGRGAAAASLGPLGEMSWRFVGPYGNRAAAAAGVAGDPAVMYVGAASGGIWKTENGGVDWRPVFDHEDVSAVGALAVSQSSPNVVWAGTGETWLIRPYYPMGDGVYKSMDGGEHWEHMGLDATGHIGHIVIDPHDPQRVFVCALGQLFKAQPERGVYRTLDGGKTWKLVLGPNGDTGCNDLAMDPADPNTLFAGMWQVRVYPWNLDSGGPDGGMYVSRDGGDTWTQLSGHGLPAAPHVVGKVAVAIAHSLPTRWYALVQDSQPTLYRSDDAGASWTMVSHDHMMLQRDSYYTNFGVSTTDPDRLYFVSPNYTISLDGGKTFLRPGRGNGFGSAGGDNHDIWIDPDNANRILVANDAGLSVSLDGSRTFEHIRLPIAQVYHVSTDDRIPYDIYGNLQDASSFVGPSNNLAGRGGFGGGITAGDFKAVGGCESGFATPDPTDPDIVWSGCYEGVISRMNMKDGQARDVSVWPDVDDGWAPRDVKYRWDWTIPLAISPFDHNRVYVGSQYVHETTDGGQSWKTISPDLTLDDKAHEGNSGGITHDNLYTYDAALIFSIAESPVKQGVIWAGTNDGQVSLTRDGGAHWTNVTKNIPGPQAHGHDLEHRSVALRRRHRLHHGEPGADGRLRRLRLQDRRLRPELDDDQRGRAQGVQQLGALHRRRSRAQGDALPGHRQRDIRELERRRQLDKAQPEPATGAGLLDHRPAALQRSGDRHLRARRLDHGRHHRPAALRPRREGGGALSRCGRRTASGRRATGGSPSPARAWWGRTRRTAPTSTSISRTPARPPSPSPVPTAGPSTRCTCAARRGSTARGGTCAIPTAPCRTCWCRPPTRPGCPTVPGATTSSPAS